MADKIKDAKLSVLDLGCSGGPDQVFSQFKDFLELNWYGVDFNKDEINKLRTQYLNKSFTFILKKVISNRSNPIESNLWPFFSASAASDHIKWDKISQKEIVDNNLWSSENVAKSNSSISLKELLSQTCNDFDLLKIDLDGEDLSFLIDFFDFSPSEPKFIVLETNFYGGASDNSTSFCNQDKFLKKKGYILGGIKPRHYSLKELPGEFVYSIFAQTNFGVPYQADCLYFKVPKNYDEVNSLLIDVVLFECFNLPDHAARLILENSELLDSSLSSKLLDSLSATVWRNRFSSYDQMMERFERNPSEFFKNNVREKFELGMTDNTHSLSRFLKKFKSLLKKLLIKI